MHLSLNSQPAAVSQTTIVPTLAQRMALRERPAGRPVMRQCWDRLLFLHWRVAPDVIQSRLPRGLTVDTFNGDAWLGVVPFFMRGIRIRGLPSIPTATNFLELNLRTYVHDDSGTPGVWFFSLDANSRLTVQGARAWFRLPYSFARMTATIDSAADAVDYQWHRRGSPPETASQFSYRPAERPVRTATAESLEFFLVERYLLFARGRGDRLYRGRVWHPPYPIVDAEVTHWDDHVIQLNGFDGTRRPPDHVLMSPGVEVDVFALY